jgi:hypothetical protein
MDVVNYMFCDIREGQSFEGWPFTRDLRQGVVPGIKYIPQYRDIGETDYNRLVGFPTSGLPAPEGLLPQHANKRGIWHLLDTRFDGLVGNCECLPDRDMQDMAYSVHFSCMAVFSKPGHFSNDLECVRARRALPFSPPSPPHAPSLTPAPPRSTPPSPPPLQFCGHSLLQGHVLHALLLHDVVRKVQARHGRAVGLCGAVLGRPRGAHLEQDARPAGAAVARGEAAARGRAVRGFCFCLYFVA